MANETHRSSARPKKSILQRDVSETVLNPIGEYVLKIPHKSKEEKLAVATEEQKSLLQEIEANAIADFSGQLDELESALGMLHMGFHFGWKVLYLIHSKRTVRKYEEILNIKIRDIFPETGPSTYRSYGFNIAERFSNFWKIVSGDTKIPDRRKIDK